MFPFYQRGKSDITIERFLTLSQLKKVNKKFKELNRAIEYLESESRKEIIGNKETYSYNPSLWKWRGKLYKEKFDLLQQIQKLEKRLHEINANLKHSYGIEKIYEY